MSNYPVRIHYAVNLKQSYKKIFFLQSEYNFQVGETVIGLFNFKKIEDEDLTFKMGEKLTIISLTHDKNWYKARNLMGNTGMVPANYIKSETIKNFYKSKCSKKYAFEEFVAFFHTILY